MKKIITKVSLVVFVLLAVFVQSCKDVTPTTGRPLAATFNAKVYHEWVNTFLQIERYAKGYRPGPAPRALAYMGYAAYEIAVPGMPENNSLGAQYAGLELPKLDENAEIHWPAAINASYELLMTRFFFHMENDRPDEFKQIEATYTRLHAQYAAETTPEILERSEKWGSDVALAIYEWSASDSKGHNAFLDAQPVSYIPPSGPGKWYNENGTRGMFPYWGEVRTFAMRKDELICKKPVPYSEETGSLFYAQAAEVKNTVDFIRAPHTDQSDKDLAYDLYHMAIFWSDDLLNLTFSPPARLAAIADQIVDREDMSLDVAVELYAKLGMALHDNGVAIWASKYYYNVERPDTYIHRVLGPNDPSAASWTTILEYPNGGPSNITPAFPAYPSGHSGFGAAGAKILSSFMEYNEQHPGTYSFTDHCHEARTDFNGRPRSFSSLYEAGEEDALSRIPLGVHFRMDCEEGINHGQRAAQRVLELPWKK